MSIRKLREVMIEKSIEAVLITEPVNRFYFSGFTGTCGSVVITQNDQHFITDFRYEEQAAQQCEGFTVLIQNNVRTLNKILKEFGFTSMGYENAYMTVQGFEELKKELPSTEFIPMGNVFKSIREVKTETEIEKTRKAAEITDQAFDHILKTIKPGMTEREVALELEFFMKKKGAMRLSFDTIVASGWRSALPHGVASDKIIENGDFVTLDFGCVYEGYCSDMTRTVVMGSASEQQQKIYEIVLEAQIAALNSIRAGVKCKDVDTAARSIIEKAGYGENFGHGTGHAIGLELHEFPRFSQQDETVLEENHIMTDEPGIYIPGFGGVRIEDLVIVKKDGYERLSQSTKELIEIK